MTSSVAVVDERAVIDLLQLDILHFAGELPVGVVVTVLPLQPLLLGGVANAFEVKHALNFVLHLTELVCLLTVFLCEVVLKHSFLTAVYDVLQKSLVHAVLAVSRMVLGDKVHLIIREEFVELAKIAALLSRLSRLSVLFARQRVEQSGDGWEESVGVEG